MDAALSSVHPCLGRRPALQVCTSTVLLACQQQGLPWTALFSTMLRGCHPPAGAEVQEGHLLMACLRPPAQPP